MKTNILLLVGLLFCVIVFLKEYSRNKWYYEPQTETCIIIDKQVRMENESTEHRNTQMVYNNHFIFKCNGRILDRTVSNDSYYSNKIGNIVFIGVSKHDLEGSRNDGEENLECIVAILAIIILLVLIIRIL